MKTRIAIVVVLIVVGVVFWRLHGSAPPAAPAKPIATMPKPMLPPRVEPSPGQARLLASDESAPGGSLDGRVTNWSTGEGVVGAELAFASDAGVVTIASTVNGEFHLAPDKPTALTLATITAPGFLPYAPEYAHSPIHVALAAQRSVRGLVVFLYPALDYHGHVVDAQKAPVAGVHVKLLGTPLGEQQLDKLATEWTTAKDGSFTFHAADDAVFEAALGNRRGWARLDGSVAITHEMTIQIADAPAHDAMITGRAVDDDGKPLGDVLVRALPVDSDKVRATAFATSAADGTFKLDHLDRELYELLGEADGHADARQRATGGDRDVTLVMSAGAMLTGNVVTTHGEAVPAFTLSVFRRQGARRAAELARSFVDPSGHFEIHVAPGDLELSAAATGWAPSPMTRVDAKVGTSPITLTVSSGATLIGNVVDSVTHQPIAFARVTCEAISGGGASAAPANPGTVTSSNGSFELTGLPPGPVAISLGAGNYHPKIEGGMIAEDGGTIGPVTIAMTQLAPGEQPTLELVGVGIALAAVDDGLDVTRVIDGGGAQAAGIVVGDVITAVDGASAIDLGVNGAVARIRGVAGTTVTLTVKRKNGLVAVVCERHPLHA